MGYPALLPVIKNGEMLFELASQIVRVENRRLAGFP